MNVSLSLARFQPVALAVMLSLAACGGGGGETPSAVTVAEPASPAAPTPSTLAVTVGTADDQLAAAMDASVAADTAAPINTSASMTALALGSDAPTDTLRTIASASAARTSGTAATAGGIFYVDAKLGNDSNNGTAAAVAAAGVGPWRTLAKLATAALAPGDTVRLACGSEWNETLKLSASGTAAKPITVTASTSACASPPAINGSVAIAATSWKLHQGNIYKTPLAGTPLQFFSATGYMTQAHHPNRGFDATLPDSVYLRMASDANSLLISGHQASTYVNSGADLKLPAGAVLAAGATLRTRTNAWLIDEGTVSAVSASRLTLAAPTIYALTAGWGYYLLGQLWMLDSPGEWHYDATTQQLYAWMPDSRAPSVALYASQRATGVDLQARQYIVVDGLSVKQVGTGVDLRGSTGITVRNSRIEDTAALGINATGSSAALISANVINRTGRDAISGLDYTLPAADSMSVLNNAITDSGVAMTGETVLSLPVRSYAAVRAGTGALVSGNTITNTGYIGVWALANSTIKDNVISGTCTLQDDCGAVYASMANNNSVISGNLIQHSRGALAGKGPGNAYTQAQGIYLDESASGVTVSGNTVIDTDNGLHLHVAANNVIKDNKLYGNRLSQIWMQETRNTDNPLGDLFGNTITGNQVVPTVASAKGLLLETQITSTNRFASFDTNHYFDRIYPTMAVESNRTLRTEYTLAQWKAATLAGVSRGLDPSGTGTSQTRFASILINGSTIVPNGKLATDATGWATWNLTKPYGTLVREACQPGWCARYVAGGSPGIVSSPNFSIAAGTWYRLSVDLATGNDKQAVSLLVRRGGGGTNGYESLSDRSLAVTANRAWARYSVIFKATQTINAGDLITKDLGARVDLQSIMPGDTVSTANLEILPITPAEALTRSEILVNASAAPIQAPCPVAATLPALCPLFVRLSDNQAAVWPYYLPARSSEIVYTRDNRLVDTDGDGIPDSQDACPNTTTGAAVNSRGCSLSQG